MDIARHQAVETTVHELLRDDGEAYQRIAAAIDSELHSKALTLIKHLETAQLMPFPPGALPQR